MKGTLNKTDEGWVVRWAQEDPRDPKAELPLHPEYVKYYFLDEDAEGGEVEFDWCAIVDHDSGKGKEYAKLIEPKTGSGVDLQKLQTKLDKLLSDETIESFHEWLERSTGPIRSYYSPKIDEMLKEIEEDDVKKLAIELWKASDDRTGNPPYIYSLGVENGYNKAKETLYTEEQLKLAYMQGYNRGVDGNPNHMDSYIQFLKETKKD